MAIATKRFWPYQTKKHWRSKMPGCAYGTEIYFSFLLVGPHNLRALLIPERSQKSQVLSIQTTEMTSVPLLHYGPCSRSGSRTLIL